jgi:predicted small metal-binding protein
MGYTLACKDLGTTCPFVARGETVEAVTADMAKHAKTVHAYTDAQLKDPRMQEQVKAALRKE